MVVPDSEEDLKGGLLLQLMSEMSSQLSSLSESLMNVQNNQNAKFESGWLNRGGSALVGLKGLLQGLRQESVVRPYLSGISRVLMNLICILVVLLKHAATAAELRAELFPLLVLPAAAECSLLELRPDTHILREAITSFIALVGALPEPSMATLAITLGRTKYVGVTCTSN